MPDEAHPVPRIYAIADADTFGGERLPDVVEVLAQEGVGWIQVRVKRASDAQLAEWVQRCVRAVEGTPSALWVDDRADVAALLDVYGVHVGQRDLPPAAVRRAIGPELKIGRSAHDDAQLGEAAADPDVDVVAIGPVFATASKDRPDPVVGLDGVRRARRLTHKPLVAIGGIAAGNLAQVLDAGADTVAMIGALGDRSSPPSRIARNVRRLLAAAA